MFSICTDSNRVVIFSNPFVFMPQSIISYYTSAKTLSEAGLPMLIGALPAAAIGLLPTRTAPKSGNHRVTFWNLFDAGLVYGTMGLGCGPWYVLAGLGWVAACLKEFVWHGGTELACSISRCWT